VRGVAVGRPRARKACPICSRHPEASAIDRYLRDAGLGPRAIARRVGGVSRRAIAHHRDVCLGAQAGEGLQQAKAEREGEG
jgi:hypothetical protein